MKGRSLQVCGLLLGALLAGACGHASLPVAGKGTPIQHVQSDADIRVAHLFTSSTGWVQTADHVLTTGDGGQSWSDVTPQRGATSPFETAFFLSPSLAWAVVRSPNIDTANDRAVLDVLSTKNGGHTWTTNHTQAFIPLTPGPVYLTFVDPLHGWMVVDLGSHAGFMYFIAYNTTDGGLTWAKEAFPQTAPVVFINPSDGFSPYTNNNPHPSAFVTHDGGEEWQRLNLVASTRVAPQLPVFSDDTHGVMPARVPDPSGADSAEAFYVTQDTGRSWQLAATVPNPNPPTSAGPATVIDASTWMAAFYAPSAASPTTTQLAITHDTGRTWIWMSARLPGALTDTISFAGSTGWAIVTQSGCRGFKTDCYTNVGLFTTADGGDHWQQLHVT